MAMLPALEAEDQLDRVDAVAAGSGRMRRFDLQKYVTELRRQADSVKPPKRATPASLQAMGITVIEEPPPPRGEL